MFSILLFHTSPYIYIFYNVLEEYILLFPCLTSNIFTFLIASLICVTAETEVHGLLPRTDVKACVAVTRVMQTQIDNAARQRQSAVTSVTNMAFPSEAVAC